MTTPGSRPEVGQQPPPPGGYTIEIFEGLLDTLAKNAGRRDARGVFELTYVVFSRQILEALRARRFEDMAWTTDMACRFMDVYAQQRALWESRDPALCRAWRVAFQAMEDGRISSLQAMLLGINAHINYDLAFVTLGASRHAGDLPTSGASPLPLSRTGVPTVRYRDFLVINQLEWEAIALVQDTVLKENSRLLYWGNRLSLRATRFMGQRILMEARDSAWYQMMLLVHARDDAERAVVTRLIDALAAGIADLILAFSLRPGEVIKNTVGWLRRGERIDPELQARILDLVRDNPVVADLGLRELAFGGADPVAVLLALQARGEHRAAAVFAQMVLSVGPWHSRSELVRFLARGSEQSLGTLETLLRAGVAPPELPGIPPWRRRVSLGASTTAVRQRWKSQLARDRSCLALAEVQANQTLHAALEAHAGRLQHHLDTLGQEPTAPPEIHDAAAPGLVPEEAGRILVHHSDRWVRTCAQADPVLGSENTAPDGETVVSIIERVLFLKETRIFMEVDVPSLVDVAERLEPRRHGPGDVLIHAGRHSGGLHVIVSGSVDVTQQRDGHRVAIVTLGPRDSVGELSALNDTPATADCTASTPLETYFLPTPVLTNLLHQHPRLAFGFICMLSKRLADTTLRVAGTEVPASPRT